jgi:hypothetical protein
MAESAFGITYDGPALTAGRMPVRDLAPALLALGDLFAEASVLLHPDRKPVALNIEATRDGSFLVHLLLEAEGAWDQMVNLFGSKEASALTNLVDIVVGVGGLFAVGKRLAGRRILKQEADPAAGIVRLTLDDQTTIEIPSDALRLYGNIAIRKQAREVVAPVTRGGIEVVKFQSRRESSVSVEITGPDAEAFEVPETEAFPVAEDVAQLAVSIVNVAFAEGNKWRLSDGENTFWATIEDRQFVRRVKDGVEAFRNGDALRVQMKVVQTMDSEGLHIERSIVEVLEHIERPTQLELSAEEP